MHVSKGTACSVSVDGQAQVVTTARRTPDYRDDLSSGLLRLLNLDGRISTRELARQLDESPLRVRNRLNELRAADMIRFVPVVDHDAAGFEFRFFVFVRVEGRDPAEIAHELAPIESIWAMTMILGPADLILGIQVRRKSELMEIVNLISRTPGVSSIEHSFLLETKKHHTRTVDFRHIPYLPDPARFPNVPTLDDRDNAILQCLWRDGRMPNAEIGRALGITEGAVRRRLRVLREENVARVVAIADSSLTREFYVAQLGVSADRSRLEEVADRLADIDTVYRVSTVLGRYDLFATVFTSTRSDLIDTLASRVRTVPYVRRIESMQVLRGFKFDYRFQYLRDA